MNRDNNMDTLLVLTLLLAAWCIIKASEKGSLGWLLLSAVLVGLGFNMKTLEAYLIVPAFGLLYLLSAPLSWKKRIWHLALALLVLLVVSLSWLVAVDLTPASQRPYVGSSQTNSEIELALGYNGLQRLTGMGGPGRGAGGSVSSNNRNAPASSSPSSPVTAPDGSNNPQSSSPSAAPGGFPGGGANNPFSEGGSPSILRMFTPQLGGQVSWLLPFALVSLIALGWQTRLRMPLSRQHQALVLWGVWLLTTGAFFSVASFFHSYYLVIIAPAICALSGINLVLLWRAYRQGTRNDWRTWMLPLVLLLTAAEQAYILLSYSPWNSVLTPLILVLCGLSALGLVLAKIWPDIRLTQIVQRPAVTMSMIALLITPALWSIYSTLVPGNSTLPTGGPMLANLDFARFAGQMERGNGAADRGRVAGGGMPAFGGEQVDSKLISYLEANQGSSRYLLATQNATSAAPIIIATGKPVMAMGGFAGGDHILNQQQLENLVKSGTVRYFLLPSPLDTSTLPANIRAEVERAFGSSGSPFGNNATTSWVQKNCTVVPTSLWQSSNQSAGGSPASANGQAGPANQPEGAPAGGMGGFGGMNQQLYNCSAVR
jgi:4-amino-4-deoxy-L-arabinose transferase-like glycosyltransferase